MSDSSTHDELSRAISRLIGTWTYNPDAQIGEERILQGNNFDMLTDEIASFIQRRDNRHRQQLLEALPAHDTDEDNYDGLKSNGIESYEQDYAIGWNACLEEVAQAIHQIYPDTRNGEGGTE